METSSHIGKTRIITRLAGYNFGSTLQAYAIQRVLEKEGVRNEILAYDEYSAKPLWRLRPFVEDCVYRAFSAVPALSDRLFQKQYRGLQLRDLQRRKFQSFQQGHLKVTSTTFRNRRELEREAADCDLCICGSDQIWSPLLFDPAMFLDFCRQSRATTVAYAPSFGVSELLQHREEIRQLVGSIDCISVREREGAEIIRQLTGREVPVVLDPTLLLDVREWRSIAQAPASMPPSIVTYFLGKDRIPHRFLAELQQETGYPLLNVSTFRSRNEIAGVQAPALSPAEFIGVVASAQIVCTDSFHGTIFAILFGRDFFSFERFAQGKESQNSRLHNLLNSLGLGARLWSQDGGGRGAAPAIDYDDVNERLLRNREMSLEFLRDALRRTLSGRSGE